MRVQNSMKNMFFSTLLNLTNILIKLVFRFFFLSFLGSEYLGLNSLFSNVLKMLSVAELGIGMSIVFYMYKPLAENDRERQKTLMNFYKKSYRLIGIVIAIAGLLILPFISFFVGETDLDINLKLAFLISLSSTVATYFLSYKRSVLYADQKNYVLNIIHIIYLLVLNIIQIFILWFTKNYYLYMIINLVMGILENIIITIIVNRKYPYLKEKNIKKIDKKTKKEMFVKIKGMLFHKIGSFVVLGTDNILISKFLGLSTVGLYSNYYVIINSTKEIFFKIIQSSTASVGNMIALETKEKQFDIFKKIRFVNFWLSTFSSIALLLVSQSFIEIWIGKQYLLPFSVLIVLVINYYFFSSRATFYVFKDAACLYYEDWYVPLFEAITNIVISIIFIKYFGLAGVFLGTIVSSFWLCFYSYPKYVYKKLFDRSCLLYFRETLSYILLFFIILFISFKFSNLIIIDNIYIEFIKNCVVSLVIPNLILLVIFCKTDNFKYFIDLFKGIFKKRSKKNA